MDFTHLHVHTQYSLLDGAARISDLVKKCKDSGMDSIAITDHGAMYGVIEFYKECVSNGIKPIIGCEFYVAAGNLHEKSGKSDRLYYHLILLAKNMQGYKNLMKLTSIGFVDGMYYKPRIDYKALQDNREGLVCLSACLAGHIPRLIADGDYDGAKAIVERFKGMFGDDFYLEIQDHGIEKQKIVNEGIIKLAKETDTKVVATNDVHYVDQEDALAQDALLCVQTNAFIEDKDRMRMDTDQFYLKTPEEMEKTFPYIKQAIENSRDVADKCNVELDFSQTHLPGFETPNGIDSLEYLKQLCNNGMEKHGVSEIKEYKDRLEFELKVISNMGFTNYFLIVWDFINFARSKDIPVGPGRGSAAGSLCAYTLGITNIDPIKYNLLFERFLNPERISMPDIDIDFCAIRRQEVIDYVIEKYGTDHVSQIITFNTMAARGCIRDVGRVLKMPYGDVDKIAKLIPTDLGITIDKALKISKELKALYDSDGDIKHLIDLSLKLEGLPRHAGTHAAGVVISGKPIVEFVPLQKNDDVITTQFTMTEIENLGLLKMDFLGLRNLSVIHEAIELIKEKRGVEIDIDNLDFEDSNVFKMIGNGDTDGVFQLESTGMRSFLKELKPSSFEDIIAGISLYRPGPMDQIPAYVDGKRNIAKVKYLHPKLEPILNMTYGCMVYQEQVMQIVRDLAGYSLGRSDLVRRAMSKKKADVMAKERAVFINGEEENGVITVPGCVRNGIDADSANKIFDQMIDFAQYAFNRSHAAAYGVIAYQTAWLKYYYPQELFAATLNSYKNDTKRVAQYILHCKKIGIKVLPPDVNNSYTMFTVQGEDVRFGLIAIKNVGVVAMNNVILERVENGEYVDFYDFVKRCLANLNKRMVECMIKVGCFDSMGYTRASLLKNYENIMNQVSNDKKSIIDGQVSLFDISSNIVDVTKEIELVPELDKNILLNYEKEIIGVYISGHPLDHYADVLSKIKLSVLDLFSMDLKDGDVVTLGGIINKKRNTTTRNNNIMAYVELEDLTDTIEVVVFPQLLTKYSNFLQVSNVVIITGKVNVREDDNITILLDSVKLATKPNSKLVQVKVFANQEVDIKAVIKKLNDGLKKGSDTLELYIQTDDKWNKIKFEDKNLTIEVLDFLNNTFTEKNIRIS